MNIEDIRVSRCNHRLLWLAKHYPKAASRLATAYFASSPGIGVARRGVQPNVVKKNVSKMHKMQQLKHFLLAKPMNYRHTYLARNALKLTRQSI